MIGRRFRISCLFIAGFCYGKVLGTITSSLIAFQMARGGPQFVSWGAVGLAARAGTGELHLCIQVPSTKRLQFQLHFWRGLDPFSVYIFSVRRLHLKPDSCCRSRAIVD